MTTKKLKAKNATVATYWTQFYVSNGICSLCGNDGIINTIGRKSPTGISVGRINFCICPNGQALRVESEAEEAAYIATMSNVTKTEKYDDKARMVYQRFDKAK